MVTVGLVLCYERYPDKILFWKLLLLSDGYRLFDLELIWHLKDGWQNKIVNINIVRGV